MGQISSSLIQWSSFTLPFIVEGYFRVFHKNKLNHYVTKFEYFDHFEGNIVILKIISFPKEYPIVELHSLIILT